MIVPVALLALACGVHVASQRRRRFARATVTGPGAQQLALPAVVEVEAEAAPVAVAPVAVAPAVEAPRTALPTVDHFEIVAVGGSALLRVRTAEQTAPAGAVLVVDSGDEMDLLTALPSAMADGAIGFACDREVLTGEPTYWLQLEGGTIALPAPASRILG